MKSVHVDYRDQPLGTVCVYLMTTEQWVKIGVARDPDFRRRQLQSSCPYEIRLVEARAFRTEDEARTIERAMHRLLADFRGHGEWFGFALESVQNALRNMSENSVWRCTHYPRSRRWPSPADKLEREDDEMV